MYGVEDNPVDKHVFICTVLPAAGHKRVDSELPLQAADVHDDQYLPIASPATQYPYISFSVYCAWSGKK